MVYSHRYLTIVQIWKQMLKTKALNVVNYFEIIVIHPLHVNILFIENVFSKRKKLEKLCCRSFANLFSD